MSKKKQKMQVKDVLEIFAMAKALGNQTIPSPLSFGLSWKVDTLLDELEPDVKRYNKTHEKLLKDYGGKIVNYNGPKGTIQRIEFKDDTLEQAIELSDTETGETLPVQSSEQQEKTGSQGIESTPKTGEEKARGYDIRNTELLGVEVTAEFTPIPYQEFVKENIKVVNDILRPLRKWGVISFDRK